MTVRIAEEPLSGTHETITEPGRHPAWRPVWWSCVLVPLIVLAPLMTQAPWADDQLNVYGYGGVYLARPWVLPVDAFRAVPYFLEVGNFRPLGRTYEWSQNVAVFALTDLFGVPIDIGLRLVAVAAAVLLTVAAVLLAVHATGRGRPFHAPPPAPAILLPFTVGAGLVAAGRASTTVLFSGLYFLSSALVLAVAAWACSTVGRPRLGRWRAVLAVAAGAGLAGFNEMACLAVPLAVVAVVLRARLVVGLRRWAIARDSGGRFVLLLCAGFLPVIVPVRMIIQRNCADGGCYDGSAAALSGAAAALPNRLVSWLPPLMWPWATGKDHDWPAGPVFVAALAALLAVAWFGWRTHRAGSAGLDRSQTFTLVGVAATILGLAALTAALNVWMQQAAAAGHYGVGWRDSALTTVGGGMLVLVVARAGRVALGAALLGLATVAAISTSANAAYRDRSATERLPYLHDRIAQEIADFDPTAGGDARRCVLRAQLLSTRGPANEPRVDLILDEAAERIAGRRFCSRAPHRPGPVPLYRG